jgi:hypothetical protein
MRAFVTFGMVVLGGLIVFASWGNVAHTRPPAPPSATAAKAAAAQAAAAQAAAAQAAAAKAATVRPVPFPVGIPRPFPVGFPQPFPVGIPRPFPVSPAAIPPLLIGFHAGPAGLFSPMVTNAHPSIYQVQGRVPSPGYVNPHSLMLNGETFGQFARNTAVLGRALSAGVPGFGLGFRGAGFGGIGPYASLAAGGFGGIGPYASLAAGGLGGYGALGGYGGYGLDGYGLMGMMMNAAYANPFYGYLKGVADVTTANAQYWKTIQEGRLLREQSYRSALETRRKIIEEANWERQDWQGRVDPEAARQREQEVALDRARHDPPMTEVLSARALNDLFRHLSRLQGKGERGPNVPLDPDLLENINVTGQDSRANVGLLKNKGDLQWPLPLTGLEFKDSREHVDRLIKDAVNLAEFGNPVEPGKLKDMKRQLDRLNATLSRNISEMSPSEYIESRRYLNLLGDAIRALEDPKVVNYFNGNWIARGKGKNVGQVANVAELIEYMSQKGLRFAPAVPGEADAYRALYHALQVFDAGMTTVASSNHSKEDEH